MVGSSPAITTAKKVLRDKIKERISRYPAAARRNDSQRMLELVSDHVLYKKAKRVGIFISMPQEISTGPLIAHALEHDKQVFVPKVTQRDMSMYSLVTAQEISSFEKTSWGIPEPDPSGRSTFEGHPAADDLLIVPCVAINLDGTRLGHGGGYYDRYIFVLNAARSMLGMKPLQTLGIGLKCQIIEQQIPTSAQDIKIGSVILL